PQGPPAYPRTTPAPAAIRLRMRGGRVMTHATIRITRSAARITTTITAVRVTCSPIADRRCITNGAASATDGIDRKMSGEQRRTDLNIRRYARLHRETEPHLCQGG